MNDDAAGQTPLELDELRQSRLTYVTTHGELDAAEQANIVAGRRWAIAKARSVDEILDHLFLRRLHREMLGDVWGWAGKYRTSGKNIGIDWPLIGESVGNLCADGLLWCQNAETAAERDSAAVDFHHRLVLIHPFVNGNGRHARLVADLLVGAMGGAAFTWGGTLGEVSTTEGDPVRVAYLEALRSADRGDARPLLAFSRA